MKLPRLHQDTPDVHVLDEMVLEASGRVWPSEVTKIYDHTLRAPAPAIYERWPILRGFDNGAPVEFISEGLSLGECWIVGPAPLAGRCAIWLLPLEIPYRDQLAAWRIR